MVLENVSPEEQDEAEARIFALIDQDESNTLSRDEWEQAFDVIDADGDGVISRKEWFLSQGQTTFFDNVPRKQVPRITREEWSAAFDQFDLDHDGDITRGEFHEGKVPVQRMANLAPEDLARIWSRCDYNGNGYVSLAEFDAVVEYEWPHYDNKPAINLAHKMAAGEDGYVVKKEFKRLLYLVDWCNDVWAAFDMTDTGDDRRVNVDEFVSAAGVLGLKMGEDELTAAFQEIDTNGGGEILFNEFCLWALKIGLAITCPADNVDYDFA